jgi:uncharacterized protein YjbI with pentapeptide repeats
MLIEIKHRFTGDVLFSVEAGSLKLAVQIAVKSKAYLSKANLSGADLSGAYLSKAYLYGANLSGAYLSGADLSGANLSGANLSKAYLSGAYLSGADLSGADLSKAYLSGANLSGAKNIVRVGPTSDHYEFFGVPSERGLMVKAGCHWFTYAEALAYYTADKRTIAPERRAYLAALAGIATARGWALEAVKTEAA